MANRAQRTSQSIEFVIARSLATASLAGFLTGLIAGGAGARIAMRFTAIAAGSADQGAITEFEATVGEITAGGTVFLVLVGGLVGVAGGLIYLVLRRWVADAGRWRGLAFSVLFLAMFGSAIIKGENPDFHLFGPPALNIAMFASMFIVFGLLIAPIFDRVASMALALPPPSFRRSGLPSFAGHAFGLVLLLPAVGGVGIVASGPGFVILPYVLFVLPIASVAIARSAGQFDRLSDLRGHGQALVAACAVVALPFAAGLVLNGLAIADILRAAE